MISPEREERIRAVAYDYEARDLEPVHACNLCGSANHTEVARRDRYGYPATCWLCTRCGLAFLSPRLTAVEYGRFYEGVYRPLVSAYHGRRIDAETLQADQRAYATELVNFLRSVLHRPPATVLDVGGSTGVVTGAVRDAFGSAPTVLDPSRAELAVARAAGMETIVGLAEQVDFDGGGFELVLLCQTIDHLLDIAGTLAALRGALAPEGRLFVDVLDLGFALRRCGAIERVAKIDHPYYLTRETACAYFTRVGLTSIAERLSDDGHWGFVLERAEPSEPDWSRLGNAGHTLLRELWLMRART